ESIAAHQALDGGSCPLPHGRIGEVELAAICGDPRLAVVWQAPFGVFVEETCLGSSILDLDPEPEFHSLVVNVVGQLLQAPGELPGIGLVVAQGPLPITAAVPA